MCKNIVRERGSKLPNGNIRLVGTSRADDGGNGKRITEGVGVLKGDGVAVNEGVAVVDKAVVVMEAFEEVGVDEPGGAEPTAAEMDAGDVAAGGANVHDFNCVSWDATWEGICGTLVDDNVRL